MVRETMINQSKQAFIHALFRLLETGDWTDVTVSQLALESGYSRRTYYRYFDSPRAILNTMFDQQLTAYRASFQTPIRPDQIPNHFIAFIWPQRQKIQILVRRDLFVPLLTQHLSAVVDMVLDISVPWRQHTSSEAEMAYRYAITYSLGGFWILLDSVFRNEVLPTPQQIGGALTAALTEIQAQTTATHMQREE